MKIRSLIAGLLFITLAAPAIAADSSACGPVRAIADRWEKEYSEIPLIAYEDIEVTKVMFGNHKTGAWTLIAVDKAGYACTMRDGTGLKLMDGLLKIVKAAL
jgi:hypothetical protein